MILQALYEYYQRKSSMSGNSDMAPSGWQWKEIPFLLVINRHGELVQIDDCREGKNRARKFLVPQEITRSSGVAANILWDKPAYIWGYDPKGKPERLKKQRQEFLDAIKSLESDDDAVQSVIAYLSDPQEAFKQAQKYSQWDPISETAPFIAMRFDGDTELICNRSQVAEKINILQNQEDNSLKGTCLVTGKESSVARLHTAIKGVPGAQTSGAPLISFNKPSFYSYGKESGDIAPVSTQIEGCYTKALNHLLGKDSKQKISYGNISVVFWASKDNEPLEDSLSFLLGHSKEDNPDERTDAVKALLQSPHKGGGASFDKDSFYILGISPNAARLSVRFWLPTGVAAVQQKLQQYFREIELVGGKTAYPPLRSLLSGLALEYKLDNLSPLLEGAMVKSIFSGADYPRTLIMSALQRMRAEQNLPHLRAALIKAYLIRNCKKEISMSLNENNPNEAYQLGRLFAVLEKAQEEAMPGINATIRDRFFASASTRPASVFPILNKLHIHHLAKLERGRAINLEKKVTEIIEKISVYKTSNGLNEQGLFAIGYYHQRQALFTKTEKPEQQIA